MVKGLETHQIYLHNDITTQNWSVLQQFLYVTYVRGKCLD